MGRKKPQIPKEAVISIDFKPKTQAQSFFLRSLRENTIVFAIGPAGGGKTYIAVSYALSKLLSLTFDKIIIVRPAVEADEKLGFLPGDLAEKMDPYVKPMTDIVKRHVGINNLQKFMDEGRIEILPLAFMRGITFHNSIVILDEAQNCTEAQMKMFITRLGEGSQLIICGDATQHDLRGKPVGITSAAKLLCDLPGVGIAMFDEADSIRHPMLTAILNKYNVQKEADQRDRSLVEEIQRSAAVS